MLENIRQTIARHRLFRPGDCVLVAVSGGADSFALLHALLVLQPALRVRLAVAHFNHQLRGRSADADQRFVTQLAVSLHLPYWTGAGDVRAEARRKKTSIEMAARDLRYAFLIDAAKQAGAHCIATAHTADDQAETFLLNLARGAGRRGLGGMTPLAKRGGVRLVRPMLGVRHRDAVAYLRRRRLAWREDASNRDPLFLRNRVRHEILPFLERRLQPGLRSVLVRTADILREEDAWLDRLAKRALARSRAADETGALQVEKLARLSLPARRRVLRLWLLEQGVPPNSADQLAVDRAESLLDSKQGRKTVALEGGWRVVRQYDRLLLTRSIRLQKAFAVRLSVPGSMVLADVGVRFHIEKTRGFERTRSDSIGSLPARAWLDAQTVGRSALWARSWKPGDRIRPLGMTGTVKLQDLFTNAKLPRDQRSRIPVLICRDQVVWVPGYRPARDWAVRDANAPSICVTVSAIEP